VIIGAAFGKIITSVVDDLIGPFLGLITGGVDLSKQEFPLGEVVFKYGSFVQSVINFLIVAFVVFLLVKAYNRFRKEAPTPPPTPTESLLAEIRDLLKAR
jgi:large conductance mechanosensitive channel